MPSSRSSTAPARNRKNRNRATSAVPAAMLVKPNMAAISEMTNRARAHLRSVIGCSLFCAEQGDCPKREQFRCRVGIAACGVADSGDHFAHDLAMHVRQPEVAAGVAVGEPLVV